MHLGVSMWSYFRKWKAGEMDIPGFIFAAKEAGAEGVELLDFFYAGEGIEEKRAAAQEALRQTGLPCPIFPKMTKTVSSSNGRKRTSCRLPLISTPGNLAKPIAVI